MLLLAQANKISNFMFIYYEINYKKVKVTSLILEVIFQQ